MGIKEKLLQLEERLTKGFSVTVISEHGAPPELYVENCRAISACDENIVSIIAPDTEITVIGAPLALDSFGSDGVKITGNIHSVSFERK